MVRKRKPTPGHKFAGMRFMFQTKCECGWASATYIGRDGQAQARNEWDMHRSKHDRSEP